MAVAACGLLVNTSCDREEMMQQTEKKYFALDVSMGEGSRTYNSGTECHWGDNEKVYVFSDDGNSYAELTLIRRNGSSATFAGTVTGNVADLKNVVYPVPDSRGRILMRHINGNNHNAPMYGQINGDGAQLSYAGGLVKLQFNSADHQGVNVAIQGTNGVTGESVIGGYYKFGDGALRFYPTDMPVSITNIPASGTVYVPVNAAETTETILMTVGVEGEELTHSVQVKKGAVTQNNNTSFPEINYVKDETTYNQVRNEQELQKAFNEGGTYKLVNDIWLDNLIKLSNNVNVTLDLGGHRVENEKGSVFVVLAGNLTLKGSGTVYAASNNVSSGSAVMVFGAKKSDSEFYTPVVNIEGGTYYVGDDERDEAVEDGSSRNDCIYLGKSDNYPGVGIINILGGTFQYRGVVKEGEPNGQPNSNSDGNKFLINQSNNIVGKCIEIKGGTFYKFNPANVNNDDSWINESDKSLLNNGYQVENTGNYYTVVPTSASGN